MVLQLLTVFVLASVIGTSLTMDNFMSLYGSDFSPLFNLTSLEPFRVGNVTKQVVLKYFNSTELSELVAELARKNDKIVKVRSLGQSAAYKKDVWAVQISRGVQEERRPLKPMFKFVANIHGDEAVGYALMVALMQYLVYNDGRNERVTRMLDTIDIWIVPSLNPDGFQDSEMGWCDSHPNGTGLTNGMGEDLDSNFPDQFLPKSPPQPETAAMMSFIKENPFVLSGNLQAGDIVASFPYDTVKRGVNGYTQDYSTFKYLAKVYAGANPMMREGNACEGNFTKGVAAGVERQNKLGSMQDFNFVYSNCFELTFYLSCCKYPEQEELSQFWAANLESMLKFIESSRLGVSGFVLDEESRPIRKAIIKVYGKSKVIRVTERGEFWRLLRTGCHKVTAMAPGYESLTIEVAITDEIPKVRRDFVLKRKKCRTLCFGGK